MPGIKKRQKLSFMGRYLMDLDNLNQFMEYSQNISLEVQASMKLKGKKKQRKKIKRKLKQKRKRD